MPRFSRCRIVLLLVLLLLPAALQAAEPTRSVPAAVTAWGVLAQVWSYLTGAQSDNGCRIDPNGFCLTGQSATATADNGCWVDPNGRCRN
ncbi:MAG TPA: hypothetical protein VGK45_06590 [Thermoanaerobaculia bacterium]